MKIIFTIDKSYDKKAVWEILHGYDPSGTENRAKSMGISREELEYILSKKKFNDEDRFFSELIENRYKINKDLINEAVVSYQLAWDEINDLFSSEIGRITGYGWKYDKYFVIVSPINIGISSPGGNKVVRSCFEDPYRQRRITAHEILMSHLWYIFYKNFKDIKKRGMQFWALNEITTVAILSLESPLNTVWGNNYENYLRNYPLLANLKFKLKYSYINKTNFISYLNEGIEVVSKEIK